MEDLPWRLAIDFGTSNTTATISVGTEGVRVLRLGSRSDAVPSCVAVYNGEITTGEAALQVAGIHPAAFEPTPKRRLSENEVLLGGQVFDSTNLVAAVLRFVVAQAIRFVGGREPAEVVLTHPEAWDAYMKQRLMDAAVAAGIPEERLVLLPEPVAAAWHYASGPENQPGMYIAVLDFGGGTCDAAVLQLADTPQGPSYQVVSSDGIDPLGGHDFDTQLENWVYAQLAAEGKTKLLQGLRSEHAAADRAVLRDQIREAKHALSFHNSAPIGVRSGKHEWVCTVTRAEFEQLIAPQVDRAVELVHQVILRALPGVEQLHRVYLSGGSSYIPLLQSKLGEILPLKLGLMGDPKQVTSIGALQTPRPSQSTDGPIHHHSRKISRWLIAGGASLGAALIAAAIAMAIPNEGGVSGAPPEPGPGTTTSTGAVSDSGNSGPPDTPTPTRTPSSPTTTAGARLCGGIARPDLSTDECALLNSGISASLISSESCTPDTEIGSAAAGISCQVDYSSVLTPSQLPLLGIYRYDTVNALDSTFSQYVKDLGAAERSVTQPPAWGDWEIEGVPQGRIMGFVQDGVNHLVWTEDDALLEMWASSSEADLKQLYAWWQEESQLGK